MTGSPTVEALTGEGTILGTLQYMAPEQLDGKEADHRTDVFAFGEVFYEMLTGTPAFQGVTQASLIASILTNEPPSLRSLQPVTPPALDHLLARSLAKDPNERWASMHDVLLQLRWIATQPTSSAANAMPAGRARERRWWMAATIGSLMLAAATAAAWLWRPTPDVPATIHFEIAPPAGTTFQVAGLGIINMTPALSHDGSAVVIPAIGTDGVRRLWFRRLDLATIEMLPGHRQRVPAVLVGRRSLDSVLCRRQASASRFGWRAASDPVRCPVRSWRHLEPK